MPKFLIRRVETSYRDIIIDAEDDETALAIGSELDYDAFKEADDLLSSETYCEGKASEDDIKELPELDAEDDDAPYTCTKCGTPSAHSDERGRCAVCA